MESPPKPLSVGSLIDGRYRLVRFIDGGGMGKVYEAADTRLADKSVAIKVLLQNLVGDGKLFEQLHRRFEQEAQLCALLASQPGIIQVSDFGIDDQRPYLVMEYLGAPPLGRSLKEVILHEGPLSLERTIRLAVQICESLQYAHSVRTHLGGRQIMGVVHRDIKPSNIFVMDRGRGNEFTKILDFGIAKAVSDVSLALGTNMGFIGTCDYASPEQLRGEDLDGRTDIYSLGIVLYQMLTGQLPLQPQTNSFAGWYQAHNHDQPTDLSSLKLGEAVPAEIARAIMSCLAKNPDQRPASMQELSERLQAGLVAPTHLLVAPTHQRPQVEAGEPARADTVFAATATSPKAAAVKARVQNPPEPTTTTGPGSLALLLGAGLGLAVVVGGGAALFWSSRSQAPPKPPAPKPAAASVSEGNSGIQVQRLEIHRPENEKAAVHKNLPLFESASRLEGHTQPVSALAVSADGTKLASGGSDRTVRLWNLGDGTAGLSLSDNLDSVRSVALARSRPLVISGGSDRSIRLWDGESGQLQRTLNGYSGAVLAVAVSPDEQVIAGGSADGTVKLWNAESGELLRTLSGHTDAVRALAFSPDGKLLATGSDDRTLRLWEVAGGDEPLRTLSGHAGAVRAIAFSLDGSLLATGSSDGAARLWDPASGKLLRTLSEHERAVNAVAISPDGKLLATGSDDRTVRLWRLPTGELEQTFKPTGRPINALAFSPDGTSLIVAGDDPTIRIWRRTSSDASLSP
ncbi:serine/threonine-protein kinase [Gloeobacter kilaueensis JS1]|uniref:Serine/threonine-protein kinase n=2 Tax=Gloeobacter TaxID=33071 RepID=U5QEW1_GLOK1|nr:serine/threonine-protein kinase [Gloeobacter kilaueensis JS1]